MVNQFYKKVNFDNRFKDTHGGRNTETEMPPSWSWDWYNTTHILCCAASMAGDHSPAVQLPRAWLWGYSTGDGVRNKTVKK